MYELGNMRRLQFKGAWDVILSPNGLKFIPLEDMFTAWVRYIYLVVGMENALENDYDFARLSSTAGEDPQELTPFKSQFLIEAHRRFLVSYLDGLIDEDLQTLLELTPFKSQFLIEAHRRFLVSYLDGLIDEDLQTLWEMTVGFCAKDQDVRWLQTELETLKA